MTLDSSDKPSASPPNLWRRAGHALDRGDQWFSSSAGRVFGWVHRESNLATEQAVLAVAEVIGLSKQSTLAERQGRLAPGETTESSSFRAPDGCELDLVWADASSSDAPDEGDGKRVDGGLAGLMPLLKALGKVVEQHGESRYASLAEDDRFWMLIEVIVSLKQTAASIEEADGESAHSTSGETKGAR